MKAEHKTENKTIETKVEFEHTVYTGSGGSMPMCGWHPNYVDFKLNDGRKGTMTFINGQITVHMNNGKEVISFSVADLVTGMIEQTGK